MHKPHITLWFCLTGGHGSAPSRNNSLPDVVGDEKQLRTLSRLGSTSAALTPSQPNGQGSASSARSGVTSRSSQATRPEELVLFRKASQSRTNAAPKDRGGGGDRGKGLKGGSMSESRRRIAQAVARRASDQSL